MNKKLVYVGLLLPFVAYNQIVSPDDTPEDETVKEQELTQPETDPEDTQGDERGDTRGDTPDQQDNHEHEQEQELDQEEDQDDDQDEADSEPDDILSAPEYARGNWYKKRKTFEGAHDVYNQVRQKEAAVAEYEAVFITKKNALTNTFEEFYQSLGVARAVIYQTLVEELAKIEEHSQPSGQLSQEERIKLTEMQEKKNLLLQLKKDFDVLNELYKAADEAMAVLMQQITVSHNFEQKAFESYEKIAQVLSDQVAEQLYAEIVAARENITGISDYIKNDFTHYFDELSDNVTKSIALVHQQMATLKEQGVDLTKVPEEKPVEEHLAPNPAPVEQKPAPAPSFFILMIDAVSGFFSRIWAALIGLFA